MTGDGRHTRAHRRATTTAQRDCLPWEEGQRAEEVAAGASWSCLLWGAGGSALASFGFFQMRRGNNGKRTKTSAFTSRSAALAIALSRPASSFVGMEPRSALVWWRFSAHSDGLESLAIEKRWRRRRLCTCPCSRLDARRHGGDRGQRTDGDRPGDQRAVYWSTLASPGIMAFLVLPPKPELDWPCCELFFLSQNARHILPSKENIHIRVCI